MLNPSNNIRYNKDNSFNVLYTPFFIFFLGIIINFFPAAVYTAENVMIPFVGLADDVHYFLQNSYKNFVDLQGTYQREIQLRSELVRLQAEIDMSLLKIDEIDALRKQLQLKNVTDKMIEAEIILPSDKSVVDKVFVNVGKKENIKRGDVVVLGDAYVGLISEVYNDYSSVKIPVSKSSIVRVAVIPKKYYKDSETFNYSKYGDGLVKGTADDIRLENVIMKDKLSVGDVVITNDERVGHFLVLGHVNSVDNDPSAPSHSGTVEPMINYKQVKYVFVLIK